MLFGSTWESTSPGCHSLVWSMDFSSASSSERLSAGKCAVAIAECTYGAGLMPGAGGGRPADPLWSAIGFAIGVIPGIYFHQVGAGLGIGIALGGAFGLMRADAKRGYKRPADPLWFV